MRNLRSADCAQYGIYAKRKIRKDNMTGSNDEYSDPVFFEKEEAIALIARIDPNGGNIKNELVSMLGVTGKTVKNRLDDAQRQHLIEKVNIAQGDHPRATRYRLTDRGQEVQSVLREMGLHEIHEQYRELEHEIEDAIPEVQSRIRSQNLHEQYPQKESWAADEPLSGEELNESDLTIDEEQPLDGESPGDDVTPEVIDVNDGSDVESQDSDTEVWGDTDEETD